MDIARPLTCTGNQAANTYENGYNVKVVSNDTCRVQARLLCDRKYKRKRDHDANGAMVK